MKLEQRKGRRMKQGSWGSLLLLGCSIAYCVQPDTFLINSHHATFYPSIFSTFKQNSIECQTGYNRSSQRKELQPIDIKNLMGYSFI